MNTKTQTLFGGRLVAFNFEDGTTGEVKVAQLCLADYEKAYALMHDEKDEIAFTAFCCFEPEPAQRKTRDWALTLHPESYELLQAAVQEVNAKGFFSFAARRRQQEQKAQEAMFAALANLPPETIQAAADLGKSGLNSPTSVPRPQPMRNSR